MRHHLSDMGAAGAIARPARLQPAAVQARLEAISARYAAAMSALEDATEIDDPADPGYVTGNAYLQRGKALMHLRAAEEHAATAPGVHPPFDFAAFVMNSSDKDIQDERAYLLGLPRS